jgi:uncharacterized protein YidB (DUF937 family)
MGILDSLLNSVMGGGAGPGISPMSGMSSSQQSPLMMMALQLLQQNGGIEGVLAKFQQAGYSDQAQSWVSTGQNMPISGDILSKVLGQGQLGQIAQQCGVSSSNASGGLAAMLPHVIDQLTPHGSVPTDGNDLVAKALSILNQPKPA